MVDMTPNTTPQTASWRVGQQPVMVAAAALVIMVLGIGSVFAWRSYSGSTPEPERLTAARLTQARVAQASEQLVEKTKGIEVTQQQSIDQLQVVQDQLQTVQRLLTSQQNETRKLTEQVGNLTGTLDNLRQSFASIPSPEASGAATAREQPRRSRSRAAASKGRVKVVVQRKRPASRS